MAILHIHSMIFFWGCRPWLLDFSSLRLSLELFWRSLEDDFTEMKLHFFLFGGFILLLSVENHNGRSSNSGLMFWVLRHHSWIHYNLYNIWYILYLETAKHIYMYYETLNNKSLNSAHERACISIKTHLMATYSIIVVNWCLLLRCWGKKGQKILLLSWLTL